MEKKNQKEYYFRIGIFRFYVVIEPDEVLPFVEFAVAVATKRLRPWKRRTKVKLKNTASTDAGIPLSKRGQYIQFEWIGLNPKIKKIIYGYPKEGWLCRLLKRR